MKKLISGLLLSGLLIGCGQPTSNPKSPTSNDSLSVAETKDTIAVSVDSVKQDSVKADTDSFAALAIPHPKIVRKTYKAGNLIRPSMKVKGIYITGPTAGTKRMKELVELITSTEMNAIVLDIKNDGGRITYKIDNDLAQEMGACIRYVRDMPGLIKDLHEKGIYVIGRIVCFKDPVLAKNKPDLALCKPNGGAVTDGKGQPWVNPYKKEGWDYLCALAEQATLDGVDELHTLGGISRLGCIGCRRGICLSSIIQCLERILVACSQV